MSLLVPAGSQRDPEGLQAWRDSLLKWCNVAVDSTTAANSLSSWTALAQLVLPR